jgi:heterodisulfide reductase subunit C
VKTTRDEMIKQIKTVSGSNPLLCFQCGMCSGACPMAESMQIYPKKAMRLLQLGYFENLNLCNTPWVCATCYACQVTCPRGVNIPGIMEALRLISLRRNGDYMEPRYLGLEVLKEAPQIALVAAFRKLTS